LPDAFEQVAINTLFTQAARCLLEDYIPAIMGTAFSPVDLDEEILLLH